jgi:integrase
MDNIKNGLNEDFREMPVSKLMKFWLFNVVRFDCADSTLDRYESVYRNYVAGEPMAQMKVYEVRTMYLKQHYNQMAEDGYSSSQIFNLNKLLKTFFNYAVAEGYILKNPCYGIKIPKNDDEEKAEDVDPFSDEEIALITAAAKGSIKAIIQFALATGLRRGEILGLQAKHMDLDSCTVEVRNALKRVKRFTGEDKFEYLTVLESTKTPGSVRDVPLPTGMIKTMRQHVMSERKKHFRLGKPYTENSLFFTSNVCTPYDGKNVGIAFGRVLKRAGVRYRSFHNLRHSYATKLFEAGVPLLTISKLLGHTNINITASIYVSVMPKQKTDAAEHLNYLFA